MLSPDLCTCNLWGTEHTYSQLRRPYIDTIVSACTLSNHMLRMPWIWHILQLTVQWHGCNSRILHLCNFQWFRIAPTSHIEWVRLPRLLQFLSSSSIKTITHLPAILNIRNKYLLNLVHMLQSLASNIDCVAASMWTSISPIAYFSSTSGIGQILALQTLTYSPSHSPYCYHSTADPFLYRKINVIKNTAAKRVPNMFIYHFYKRSDNDPTESDVTLRL